jgi:hypothetical protein
MAKDNIKRFPRPMGTTAMAAEYQKSQNLEDLQKVYNYIINHWLMGNGMLCGIMYDINTFSTKTGIDINYIRVFMRDRLLQSKLWDKERQEEMLQALLGEQVAWALEDRMEISHQVNILRESQGGHYTPFISAELNKALKMKLDSSTSLQSIIRTFMGGGTTNIFNQFGDTQNNQLNQNQGISIEEARKIILESQKIMDKPQEAKLLADHYDLSSLPEVVATKQEGIDTTKEGLTLNTAEMRQITDDYKGAMELSSREHHELRREIEANIDPGDPDPEMDIYLDEEQYEEKEPTSIAEQFLNR